MSKDAYYFPHDSNARNDLKIVKLRSMDGLAGVGLYWCVIEMLREADEYKLLLSDIDVICFELRCKKEQFQNLFICELLDTNDTHFWANSLNRRMAKIAEISNKRRLAGTKPKQNLNKTKTKLNKIGIKENKIKENNKTLKPPVWSSKEETHVTSLCMQLSRLKPSFQAMPFSIKHKNYPYPTMVKTLEYLISHYRTIGDMWGYAVRTLNQETEKYHANNQESRNQAFKADKRSMASIFQGASLPQPNLQKDHH